MWSVAPDQRLLFCQVVVIASIIDRQMLRFPSSGQMQKNESFRYRPAFCAADSETYLLVSFWSPVYPPPHYLLYCYFFVLFLVSAMVPGRDCRWHLLAKLPVCLCCRSQSPSLVICLQKVPLLTHLRVCRWTVSTQPLVTFVFANCPALVVILSTVDSVFVFLHVLPQLCASRHVSPPDRERVPALITTWHVFSIFLWLFLPKPCYNFLLFGSVLLYMLFVTL